MSFLPEDMMTLIVMVVVSTVIAKVTSFVLRLMLIGILIFITYFFLIDKVDASMIFFMGVWGN